MVSILSDISFWLVEQLLMKYIHLYNSIRLMRLDSANKSPCSHSYIFQQPQLHPHPHSSPTFRTGRCAWYLRGSVGRWAIRCRRAAAGHRCGRGAQRLAVRTMRLSQCLAGDGAGIVAVRRAPDACGCRRRATVEHQVVRQFGESSKQDC